MNDFLSAAEIDALFDQANSGRPPVESSDSGQGRRTRWLRTVDFSRPSKFGIDQQRRAAAHHGRLLRLGRHAAERRAPPRGRARGHRRRPVHLRQRHRVDARVVGRRGRRDRRRRDEDAHDGRAHPRPRGHRAPARRHGRQRLRARAHRHRARPGAAPLRGLRGVPVGHLVRRVRREPRARAHRPARRGPPDRARQRAGPGHHRRGAPGAPLDDPGADRAVGDARARRGGLRQPRRGRRPHRRPPLRGRRARRAAGGRRRPARRGRRDAPRARRRAGAAARRRGQARRDGRRRHGRVRRRRARPPRPRRALGRPPRDPDPRALRGYHPSHLCRARSRQKGGPGA